MSFIRLGVSESHSLIFNFHHSHFSTYLSNVVAISDKENSLNPQSSQATLIFVSCKAVCISVISSMSQSLSKLSKFKLLIKLRSTSVNS
ncbi:MAG: hypothetical protein BWY04_00067 [candidate division CPR1 bacterium ADurb.Bin160]|uniref:Uncharacterized protein n=1 Tax=candidate division CPR1 bacterium ADurb.Bin160 TaxID=1852826 RepID=A0A1V5ZRC7_9BACT|nr:MAG: hypothetical protein BWY04_00067 [candidate division CPR1 bacterium ADurb.Bin160]